MKLRIFDEHRLGLVIGEEMVDVTEALPHYDPGYAANFWLRMCRDFDVLRPRIERASREFQQRVLGHRRDLSTLVFGF